MADRVFTIVEQRRAGDGSLVATAARFEWTADGRSAPLDHWEYGIALETVRKDYPGTEQPTEQVMNTHLEPFTLRGKWDDRWNSIGYAEDQRTRFEQLVSRSNLVRLSFEALAFVGLITKATITYRRKFDIGWEFTFSPHYRVVGSSARRTLIPKNNVLVSPQALTEQALNGVALLVTKFAQAPRMVLTGELYQGAKDQLDGIVASAQVAAEVMQSRVLAIGNDLAGQITPASSPGGGAGGGVVPPVAPGSGGSGAPAARGGNSQSGPSSIARAAQSFVSLRNACAALSTTLRSYRSDTGLAFSNAVNALAHDDWVKGSAAQARFILVAAQATADELQGRVTGDTLAFYRPYAGESLYSISNRFYRTPHRWRAISERNNLHKFTLDGTEDLVIPDLRGGA